jgi:hypothetical protein
MGPRLRKLMLFLHVTSSVGWIGAAVAYVGICVSVVLADSATTVQALYHVMQDSVTYVILPFGIISFVTGLVVSLGTVWGLFRHYWVIVKFGINVVSLVVLYVYTDMIGTMVADAEMAASMGHDPGELQSPGIMSHVLAGVVLLLVATWLAVYKPKGQTRMWRRKQWERRQAAKQQPLPVRG